MRLDKQDMSEVASLPGNVCCSFKSTLAWTQVMYESPRTWIARANLLDSPVPVLGYIKFYYHRPNELAIQERMLQCLQTDSFFSPVVLLQDTRRQLIFGWSRRQTGAESHKILFTPGKSR